MNGRRQSWGHPVDIERQDVRIVKRADTMIVLLDERLGRIAIRDAKLTLCRVGRGVRRRMRSNACVPDNYGKQ